MFVKVDLWRLCSSPPLLILNGKWLCSNNTATTSKQILTLSDWNWYSVTQSEFSSSSSHLTSSLHTDSAVLNEREIIHERMLTQRFMLGISWDFPLVLTSFGPFFSFLFCFLCLCRSLRDIKQHRGTRYFRVRLHEDAGNYAFKYTYDL